MTARPRKNALRARGKVASAPPRGPKSGARSPLLPFLLPVAMLALAGVLIAVTLQARRAAAVPDAIAARMDPEAAYRRAIEISSRREWRESLPYYRRALEGPQGREWRPHFNYGIVLNNLTLHFENRAGQQVSGHALECRTHPPRPRGAR